MRCQVCGFDIKNPGEASCPNCGWALARTADQTGSVSPAANPPAPPAPAPAAEVPQSGPPAPPPVALPVAGSGGMPGNAPGDALGGAPAMPPPYGWPAPPSVPYGAPGYAPPPGYMPPPGYGQPLPPGAPYAAPPTYPLPAGAPPSMPLPYGAPYAGYPAGTPFPGYPGGAPPGPPPTPPKRRTGLIVGLSAAVVLVLLVAAAGALYAFVPQVRAALTGTSVTPTVAVSSAPTATATPGEAILYQNTFASAAADWANDTHCFLGSGGYHVKDGFICYAPVGDQVNADVTVDAKQISGANNDIFGISLRLNRTNHTDYEMDMDALGHWVFYRCGTSTCDRLIDFAPAASIHAGLNATNKLEAKVKGAHFDFFINDVKIGQFDDSTYTSGLIGLACGGEQSECVFSNLTIAQPN